MSGYGSTTEKGEERLSLLNSRILQIYIGIEPIKGNAIQSFFQKLLRANFHYSCFLKLSRLKSNEGIILEYGVYYGENSSYKNYIHYGAEGKDNGIRFCKMSFDDYEKKIHNGLKGSQILGRTIVINNEMTLRELIEECVSKSDKSWGSSDYNISSHNCKHFIFKVIEVFKVTRDPHNCSLFCYNIRHGLFPPEILEALENNEDENVKSRNEIEPPLLKKFLDNFKIININLINLIN